MLKVEPRGLAHADQVLYQEATAPAPKAVLYFPLPSASNHSIINPITVAGHLTERCEEVLFRFPVQGMWSMCHLVTCPQAHHSDPLPLRRPQLLKGPSASKTVPPTRELVLNTPQDWRSGGRHTSYLNRNTFVMHFGFS